MKKLATVVSMISLVASLFISSHASANELEVLKGIITTNEGITFQVFSGGCTSKEDFELILLESYPTQIQLVRINEDFCEAYLPHGVLITFDWREDIGLDANEKYIISNKIVAHQMP